MVSNKVLLYSYITNQDPISLQIQSRKWGWIIHINREPVGTIKKNLRDIGEGETQGKLEKQIIIQDDALRVGET